MPPNFEKGRFYVSAGALKRVISFISTAIKISKGLLEQCFDYCSVVWDSLSRQLSEKVKKLQNTRTARAVTKSSYDRNSESSSTRLAGITYQLQGRSKRQI